jgi:hypothetical protein
MALSCEILKDLGAKAKEVILKLMVNRAAFLNNESHRIRFVYLRKQTSWLNQSQAFAQKK